MKWSSCNAVNESPQVLLGFKAHCCLQQPPISRGGNTHCVNLGCAVRPQRVAEDSSSFLPSPMPCSPADSAACPHSPPCSPHPSHTVCCSFRHPPPKLENLPPDVPKAAWSITLAALVTLSVQKNTPKQFFLYSLKAMVLKKHHLYLGKSTASGEGNIHWQPRLSSWLVLGYRQKKSFSQCLCSPPRWHYILLQALLNC